MFGRRRAGNSSPENYGLAGADAPVLLGDDEPRGWSVGWDWGVLLCTGFLVLLGTVMVYSASVSLGDSQKFAGLARCAFLVRHAVSVALGAAALLACTRVPLRTWDRLTPWILGLAVLLLAAVLWTPLGVAVNGSRRWLRLGVMNLQVTEAMKFAAVLAAAYYTVRRQEYMHSFVKGFLPMAALMGLITVLVNLQPDLGAILVISAILIGGLFLGGLHFGIFCFVIALVVGLVTFMIIDTPWRMERFLAYLDPWSQEHALGKAYQLSHSLIAFGRGEWFGAGLGASVEKLHYLPEAHTDFILAVIGEELGFAGVFTVLAVYYVLVRRAFAVGRQAIRLGRVYSGLVAQCVGLWIGVQVIFNGAVATGLAPTKGLTLPLLSYGGSSMLAVLAAVGLLLRVDRENRILMRGGRV